MGLFSRFATPTVPRWAFRTGWSDFVVALREEARCYGLAFDNDQLATGLVPLPVAALVDTWDLRTLATRCRDLDPHEWLAQIRASLFAAYGREGDVELVDGPPPGARR